MITAGIGSRRAARGTFVVVPLLGPIGGHFGTYVIRCEFGIQFDGVFFGLGVLS